MKFTFECSCYVISLFLFIFKIKIFWKMTWILREKNASIQVRRKWESSWWILVWSFCHTNLYLGFVKICNYSKESELLSFYFCCCCWIWKTKIHMLLLPSPYKPEQNSNTHRTFVSSLKGFYSKETENLDFSIPSPGIHLALFFAA